MACQCTETKACYGCVKDLAQIILELNRGIEKLNLTQGDDNDEPSSST